MITYIWCTVPLAALFMKVVLQGEFHISNTDREKLLERVTESTDAVFVEGRSDNWADHDLSIGYAFFLIGVTIFLWGQSAWNRFRGNGIIEQITADGIDVYDEIDKTLPDLYDQFSTTYKILTGILPGIMLIFALVLPMGIYVTSVRGVEMELTPFVRLLLLAGSPVLFSFGLVILDSFTHGARDIEMSQSIIEHTKGKDWDEIVVSCGQQHLKPLMTELEREGFEVDGYDTTHKRIAKLYGADLVEQE